MEWADAGDWNRQVATVRSFLAFCRRRCWLIDDLTVDLERRPEPADRTKAIPLSELERLWRREDVSVREKALWRLLYETAARASEALAINVEDLELENKRVRIRSKGGDTDWLHFQAGAARLLPRLIRGRTRGPLFLADRRPVPARAPATVDRCPETGRGRLSYRRAEALFREASGGVDAAPAAPLGPHPFGCAEREPAAADGQEPPRQPAVAPALCPPGCRGGSGNDRGHRPGAPTQPRPARVGVIRSNRVRWSGAVAG
jgi:integrase